MFKTKLLKFLQAVWTCILAVWHGICTGAKFVWKGIKLVGIYIWKGIRITGIYIWKGIRITGIYIWKGMKITGIFIWKKMKLEVPCKFIWKYVVIAAKFVWKYVKIAALFVWIDLKLEVPCKFIWKYVKIAALFVWKYVKIAAKFIWKYVKIAAIKIYREFMSAKTFWTAFVIMVILLVLSIIVLSLRLYDYVKIDDRSVSLRTSMDESLNVFAMEYKNKSGEITVHGNDGSKVIAPGTSVEYTLRLRNTDKIALDYVFIPAVKFTSEYELPIVVRLLDPNDNYVIGNETTWIPLSEINDTECKGTLFKNETAEYEFQWKWPYESGDDAYDSFLGSAEIGEDIGVQLSFALHSEANTDIKENGGFFASHPGKIVVLIIIFLLVAAAITLLIVYVVLKKRKLKKDLEQQAMLEALAEGSFPMGIEEDVEEAEEAPADEVPAEEAPAEQAEAGAEATASDTGDQQN